MRSLLRQIFVGLLIICSYFTIHLLTRSPDEPKNEISIGDILALSPRKGKSSENIKYILLWNRFCEQRNWYLAPENELVMDEQFFAAQSCPSTACVITSYPQILDSVDDFDAVVIHGRGPWDKRNAVPKIRKQTQRYVMALLEAPHQTSNNFKGYEGIFNWTMTYRMDSDLLLNYGIIRDTDNNAVTPSRNINWIGSADNFTNDKFIKLTKRKTKMAAWMVSHCNAPSKRDQLVRAIRKHIPVDIYGKCGYKRCPRSKTDNACYKMLEQQYKFYFSFENAVCNDYVTEKLFEYMKYDIVPVVYGGANYSYFVPPHSYINANDYKTVKELADYLRFLDKHPEEYIKYFWWKEFYTIDRNMMKLSFCKLCEKLHATRSDESVKWYKNINKWLTVDQCNTKIHIANKIKF